MEKLSDEELLNELKKRFEMNRRMTSIQKELMLDLRKANEKLLESEVVQSEFLSNMRNEINNPLSAIIGLSQELRNNTAINKDCSRKVNMIFNEAFKLEQQVQNIFVAAELEAGEIAIQVAKVDVNLLVKDIVQTLDHLCERKNIQINFKEKDGGGNCIFNTDAKKMHAIVSNLLMNAIEFSNVGGAVSIYVSVENTNTLVLAIEDEGEGIGEENLDKIFDRFVQLDVGTTKQHQGQGMGLSVVKALTEFLEGSISVKSTINEGSVFTVTIPQGYINTQNEFDFAEDENEFLFFDNGDSVNL